MEMAMRGIGPDRRALRDRRARRRRDHQRRPRPPRAARDARGDRRGQGRDPRRARRERPRGVPADAEALEPHLRDALDALTFGPGGDVFALSRAGRGERIDARIGTPHGEADFEFPFDRGAQPAPTRSARSRSASPSVSIPAAMATLHRADRVLAPARRADRAARGDPAAQRLLQRQPDLDARRDRAPRRIRDPARGRTRRGPRRHGRARARRPPTSTRRSAPSPASAGSIAADRRRRARPRLLARRVGAGRRRRAPSWSPRMLGEGDVALVKGSRSVGLERLTDAPRGADSAEAGVSCSLLAQTDGLEHRPGRPRRDPDRGHGGDADHDLPRAEVHRAPARARVRPADPRGGAARAITRRRARRRWAG